MKALCMVIGIGGILAASGWAETVMQRFQWEAEIPDATASEFVRLVEDPAGEVAPHIEIKNRSGSPRTVTIVDIASPGITSRVYAVRGMVSYTDVKGEGYFELLSHFGDKGPFFTRTLADRGPMSMLTGDSRWRSFSLPFQVMKLDSSPSRLVVNVVLPETGTVRVGPLEVVAFTDGESPLKAAGQWWGDRMGGVVGGSLGAALGLLGALIGILGGTGKAPRAAMGLMTLMLLAGIALLMVGIVALLHRQPYAVYYPMLLTGAIATILTLSLRPVLRRRFV